MMFSSSTHTILEALLGNKSLRQKGATTLHSKSHNSGFYNQIVQRTVVVLRESQTPIREVSRYLVVSLLASLILGILIKISVGLLFCITVLAIRLFKIKKKITVRRAELDRDLPVLLNALASSVRAGLDPIVALTAAKQYFHPSSVVAQALVELGNQIQSGASEQIAIDSFCDGVAHPDLPLVRASLLLSRKHGSSLAEPLQRVVRVVRQRQSFRRKTRGALVMHRMSAIGITGCAALIGALQLVTNFDAVIQAMNHVIASKVLIAALTLMIIGVFWMMNLGQEEAT